MKRLLLLGFILSIISILMNSTTYAQETVGITNTQYKTFKKGLPKGVNARFDRFEGTIFITTKKLQYGVFPKGNIDFYVVLTQKGAYMRYRNNYYSTDWLFCNETTFMFGGKNKKQTLFKITFEDDNREVTSSGNISEKTDLSVKGKIKEMMDFIQVTENKTFVIKYSGDKGYNVIGGFTKGLKKHVALMEETLAYAQNFAIDNFLK